MLIEIRKAKCRFGVPVYISKFATSMLPVMGPTKRGSLISDSLTGLLLIRTISITIIVTAITANAGP